VSKISIIGAAGTLGAAIAFELSRKKKVTEICLLDVNEPLLLNHVMDLQNAYPHKKIYLGKSENLVDSEIIIITAGIPNRTDATSRNEFLAGNLRLFSQFGKSVKTYAPNALVITASNPVDILNYYLYKKFSINPQQLIGYTMNDSLRFEWALRDVMDIDHLDHLFTPVLGEHGSTQVPIFSHVLHNGKPFTIPTETQEHIKSRLKTWFLDFNALNVNRTTGWTTASGIGGVVEKLLNDSVSEIMGSAIVEGPYGLRDISIGVPLLVNKHGIQKVEEWKLSNSEMRELNQSANFLTETINQAEIVF
jgi:malate dehydrogenase